MKPVDSVAHPSDDLRCARCEEVHEARDLDRLLWCEPCIQAARRNAMGRGMQIGAVVAVVVALWIWFAVRPSNLVIGGWVGVVVGSWYVGLRVSREVIFGLERSRAGRDSSPQG